MENNILINTERYLLFAPDIHVGIGAKIGVKITGGQISEAIRLSCLRHPLLTSTIRFDSENRAFYALGTSRPIVPEYIEAEDFGSIALSWMNGKNRAPFDLENGPLLRILLVRSNNETCVFMLGHHILGDGLGYVNLLKDFLGFLDGKASAVELIPPIIRSEADFPKKTGLRLILKPGLKFLNSKYEKSGKSYNLEDYRILYQKLIDSRGPAAFFSELTEEETSKIIKNCKARGVTVNEGITAAFASAREEIGGLSRYIGIAVDARKDLTTKPLDCMGNFVSGIAVKDFRYDNNLDFWENAIVLKNLTEEILKNKRRRLAALTFLNAFGDGLKDAINFYPFEENPNKIVKSFAPRFYPEKFKGLGVSNLGKQSFDYSFPVSNAFFIPPLFASGDLIAGIITVNGRMSVCLRYGSKEISPETVKRIYDRAIKLLLQ
jgi:Uncharacterized protein containing a NRPS condensation (elongation) domain